MTNKNDGGNAFPYSALRPDGFTTMYADSEGMSLRDYFAAKAMQGALAAMVNNSTPLTDKLLAAAAYRVADTMLAERAGNPANNNEPKSGEFIQYFSVAEGRWVGGKFIGMFLGLYVVGSAEGNIGTVKDGQIKFAEHSK